MIGIVFEHPTWLAPLFEALEARRLPFKPIDVSRFAYDMQPDTVLPLYVNRLSASSYQRGNQRAIALALSYFTYLVARGARVLNSHNAHLEMNKADQLLAFQQHGLLAPRTWVFNDPEQLRFLPDDFPFPLLIKPAQGGAGSLIQRFDTRQELADGRASLPLPPDALMLAQAYIQPAQGFINRVEMLDGRPLYALKVYPAESFNLCPADACDLEHEAASSARFVLNDALDPAVVEPIRTLFRALQLDFGSIEFLEAADGRRYFYDLNLNSNYRTQLPGVERFDPWGTLADYLGAQLEAACARSTQPEE
jgi:glutathione synthase/RimK-type ligase-like ATP-grasp enzyme